MPAIITHDIFARRVYDKVIDDYPFLKDSRHLYQIFSQSHDYLFYYKTPNRKKTKHINHLGHVGHWYKTQDYLINLILGIQENKLENNSDAMAYLFGSITHYVLDSTCHPFIFYKTGTYYANRPETFKYAGEHGHMERDLDAYYYLQTFKKEYKYCNVARDIIGKPYFSPELIDLISNTYKKTYEEENIGLIYKKSINIARRLYAMFINDRFGIKRSFYKVFDKITKYRKGYIASYSTHIDDINLKFLNLEHKEWNHPCYKDMKYTYSFDNLLDLSEEKCIKIYKEITKYFNNKISLDKLKESIPNISYSTGLDVEDETKMKYFEY